MATTCSSSGCNRITIALGLCGAHYLRQGKYGTTFPEVPIGTSGCSPIAIEERATLAKNQSKRCSKCRKVKSKKSFTKSTKATDGLSYLCKICQKNANFTNRYGIDLEAVERMINDQDGRCALCRTPFGMANTLVKNIDHSHKTGEVRGVLCSYCNTSLGLFEDRGVSPQLAQDYIDRRGIYEKKESA